MKSNTPILERDSWQTPDWLYRWLNDNFYFEVDLAASDTNAKCKKYYTIEQDSLSQNWSPYYHAVGFCNPPYSNIKPWLQKAVESAEKYHFQSVFVLPSLNGASWQQYALEASELLFINGRVAFVNSKGEQIKGNTSGTVIAVFDKRATIKGPDVFQFYRDQLIRAYS